MELIKQSEIVDPKNPFLRVREAKLALLFDRRNIAFIALKEAIKIEPDYLEAIMILEKKFDYYKDNNKFNSLVERIKIKRKDLKPKKGSYLHDLYSIY
jgi:hypothetical protein